MVKVKNLSWNLLNGSNTLEFWCMTSSCIGTVMFDTSIPPCPPDKLAFDHILYGSFNTACPKLVLIIDCPVCIITCTSGNNHNRDTIG